VKAKRRVVQNRGPLIVDAGQPQALHILVADINAILLQHERELRDIARRVRAMEAP
jgi:hypothetical protein